MEPITCARKARLLPDASVDEAAKEKHDVIILPGGLPGSETLAKVSNVSHRYSNDCIFTDC